MLNVKIEISGDKETIAKFQKMGGSLKDWTTEFKKIAEHLQNFYQVSVFETEGGILGLRWASLKPSYDLLKRKMFPGRGILVRSGDLKKGYQYKVTPTSMELENRVTYAKFHQYGTSRMPARVLIHFNEEQKTYVVNVFKEGLERKIQTVLKPS